LLHAVTAPTAARSVLHLLHAGRCDPVLLHAAGRASELMG
jgi:hypothetical protein